LLAVVTAVPDLKKGERLIVFHLPIVQPAGDKPVLLGPDRICQMLLQAGLPNLWIPSPDSFIEIAEVPTLGSGKLDLKKLLELALERFGADRSL